MKIQSIKTNPLYFKSLYQIDVSKKIFEPFNQNILTDYFTFNDFLDDVIENNNEKNTRASSKLNSFLINSGFKKRKLKFFSIMEQPFFHPIIHELKKRNLTVSWFRQNTKTEIKNPDESDYYSFFVYTKEHQKPVAKLFSNSQLKKIEDKILSDLNGVQKSEFWLLAKTSDILSEEISKITKDEEIKFFKADTTLDLFEAFKKIET